MTLRVVLGAGVGASAGWLLATWRGRRRVARLDQLRERRIRRAERARRYAVPTVEIERDVARRGRLFSTTLRDAELGYRPLDGGDAA